MRSGFGPDLVRQELICSPPTIRTSSSGGGAARGGGLLLVEAEGIEPAVYSNTPMPGSLPPGFVGFVGRGVGVARTGSNRTLTRCSAMSASRL